MAFMVEAVQDVCSLPLYLDTSNPSAIAAGLKVCREKPIINGFSLEPAKIEKILPLAATFDCDIIGFLLYPNGMVPRDAQERLTVAGQLHSRSLRSAASSTFATLGSRRLILKGCPGMTRKEQENEEER